MRFYPVAVFLGLTSGVKAVLSCPEEPVLSCSAARANDEGSSGVDTCCVFRPGLVELSQTWNKERKQWVIDITEYYPITLATNRCDGTKGYNSCGQDRAYSPSKIHNLVEGYARHIEPLTEVSRSLGWAGIAANASDEEVAATWAQQWAAKGSCISTFASKCFDKTMPPGEEEAWNDPGPALFVQMMHELSRKLARTEPPRLNELPKRSHYLQFYGSPHLANFVEETTFTEREERKRQRVGKLSLVAARENLRVREEDKHDIPGQIDHDEL